MREIPEKPSLTSMHNEISSARDGVDFSRHWAHPAGIREPESARMHTRNLSQIYDYVARDDQVMSCFQQRQLAVSAAEWSITPGNETPEARAAASFLEEEISALNWDAISTQMLHCRLYGYAVAEIIWKIRPDRRIGIERILVRKASRFGFDSRKRLLLRTKANPAGEILPENKFWHIALAGDHSDNPYGTGLVHYLFWPVYFKRNNIREWTTFLEKHALPTVVGIYPPGTSEHDQEKLLEAAQAVRRDSAIVFPEGMRLELLESKRSASGDFASFLDRMNASIARVLLGQTLTTESGGSYAQASVHNAVRLEIVKADADLLCESFNQGPARWMTAWNFGPHIASPALWRDVRLPNISRERPLPSEQTPSHKQKQEMPHA